MLCGELEALEGCADIGPARMRKIAVTRTRESVWGGHASEQYECVMWYGCERDPTPVAVGRPRVHARKPRQHTVPRHGSSCPSSIGTREEPGTLTQGGALFSLVPLVWESNPKLQGGWCKTQPPAHREI
jgi:hypothetical protein